MWLIAVLLNTIYAQSLLPPQNRYSVKARARMRNMKFTIFRSMPIGNNEAQKKTQKHYLRLECFYLLFKSVGSFLLILYSFETFACVFMKYLLEWDKYSMKYISLSYVWVCWRIKYFSQKISENEIVHLSKKTSATTIIHIGN